MIVSVIKTHAHHLREIPALLKHSNYRTCVCRIIAVRASSGAGINNL